MPHNPDRDNYPNISNYVSEMTLTGTYDSFSELENNPEAHSETVAFYQGKNTEQHRATAIIYHVQNPEQHRAYS
ncbi:hypothetical protein FF38_07360 [Lucilia cuprina]|uniref:Uncharacterized protein n=1 Tax=Lucilia cuprina TaxID=7375 RepID=A0A0L0CQJ9_LUCCU|nr:hypothetical protein FF38_07360 [Lucilia cuprina]